MWQHHDQDNLYTKELICAGGVGGLRVHHGREVWHLAAGVVAGAEVRTLILNLKQEAGGKKATFGVNAFKLSKPASSKATLILPKQPPTGA